MNIYLFIKKLYIYIKEYGVHSLYYLLKDYYNSRITKQELIDYITEL